MDHPDSAVQISSLYLVVSEHARHWMNHHPHASKEDLIEHLSHFKRSWPMSLALFDEIVLGIANRVFFVRSLNKKPKA